MKQLFFVIFFLISTISFGQNKILDSLNNVVQSTENDTVKIETILEIGDLYEYTQPDSALFFYKKAQNIAENCGCNGLLAQSLNDIAFILIDNGDFVRSLKLIDTALSITNDSLEISYLKNALAIIYIQTGQYHKAFEIYMELLKYYENKNSLQDIATTYSNLSGIYNGIGLEDSTYFYLKKALKIDQKLKDSLSITIDYLNLGNVAVDLKKFDDAEQFLLKAEKLANQLGYKNLLSDIYTGFGQLYADKEEYEKSVDYFHKSIEMDKNERDSLGISQNYLALSKLYLKIDNLNLSKVYLDSALVNKKSLTLAGMRDLYFQLYKLYEQKRMFDSALSFYKLYNKIKDSINLKNQTIQIKTLETETEIFQYQKKLLKTEKISEKKGKIIIIYLIMIIGFVVSSVIIGIILFRLRKNKKILEENQKVLQDAARKRAVQIALYNLQTKAFSFSENEKIEVVLQALLEDVLQISWLKLENKGVIFLTQSDGNLHQVASVNIGELTQKCAVIKPGECLCGTALLNNSKVVETEITHNHTISSKDMKQHGHYIEPIKLGDKILGVLNLYLSYKQQLSDIEVDFLEQLALLLAGIIDRRNKALEIAKKAEEQDKLNQKLFAQSLLMEQQKLKIERSAKKLEEQGKIIKQQLSDLQSSVTYASYIVNSLLPSDKYISSLFKEYFIIFKPVQEIGGDFYYAKKIGNKIFLAVGDATGHGVPGAFLAAQSITYIRGMIDRGEALEPAKILTQLRTNIKRIFKYADNESLKYSGLDIAFCMIDIAKNVLSFAGAYSPLLLIRDNELVTYKGTKSPVGLHLLERDFEQHEIELKKDDLIYLMSDGYSDQFGGKNYSKYGIKNLKKFLLKISNEPLFIQKRLLEDNFKSWKGDNEQIDDVTILGIKY